MHIKKSPFALLRLSEIHHLISPSFRCLRYLIVLLLVHFSEIVLIISHVLDMVWFRRHFILPLLSHICIFEGIRTWGSL